MDRREALALLAAAPAAAAFTLSPKEVEAAHRAVQAAGGYSPKFFTPHEYETVGVLVDIILPRDARSGGATDAGVPEFMDFMMDDQPERQAAMRGGLAWIDLECRDRFGRTLLEASGDERTSLLDDIAWPERAASRPELSHGVAFFSAFRDLTATGFFTSKMGMDDLDYRGNVFVTEWTGCPEEALRKLGLA